MIDLIISLLLVTSCWAGPRGVELDREWVEFKEKFNKAYKNDSEHDLRKEIFLGNRKKIEEHNEKYKKGEALFYMKLNSFSDLKHDEVNAMLNGFKKRPSSVKSNVRTSQFGEFPDPPDSVDWRQVGAVVDVKNQGSCGSCWAFSTVGALESQYFLKTGTLVSLSEQNLVDCSTDYYNDGCDGGWMESANQYIADNGGIDTEESYPYEGKDGECRFTDKNIGASSLGYINLPYKDENALKLAIAHVGPISVSMNAGHPSFHSYAGGIYYEPECDPDDLDHGVLAVGYGATENGTEYWIVKNSWGVDWGEDGYFRIIRNKNNNCGISSDSTYPIV